jgi:hypothetical protein
MSTEEFRPDDQAADRDDAVEQPAGAQPAEDDEVETAVDAITAEDEDDAPAETAGDPGE